MSQNSIMSESKTNNVFYEKNEQMYYKFGFYKTQTKIFFMSEFQMFKE